MSENIVIDERIYDEMDNICSEVMESGDLVNYITARREAFTNMSDAVSKYFKEEIELGNLTVEDVKTYGDFYYLYMAKYSNCYLYGFNQKGYTSRLEQLLINNGIDTKKLDINWKSFEEKEEKYQECLIDILYSVIDYELRHKENKALLGLNIGYKSVFYYVVDIEKHDRILEAQELVKVFDTEFLESIYGEIFEVVGDINVEGVQIGDFIEKKNDKFRTLFVENNIEFTDLDEDDETKVKILL